MITKLVTKQDGSTNYDELFRAAEEHFNPPAPIKTIHDYFNVIENVRSEPQNYYFLRLPVSEDEPLFEINANTREIIVPEIFKQNGLTIQGDKLAEIVYFKIDRFFELMDFYQFYNDGIVDPRTNHDGPHCYIEWYNPSAKDPRHQRGVDFAYGMTCDDEYVYFGWPLADKVSGEAGKIQFSVRFLNIQDDKVVYNFATKIAQCEIKNTLNFNLEDNSISVDAWEEILYSRPIYSAVINSVESPAAILIQGIETEEKDMQLIQPMKTVEVEDPENPGTMIEQEVPDPEAEPYWNLDIPVIATVSRAIQAGQTQTLSFEWRYDGKAVPDKSQQTDASAVLDPPDPDAMISTFHARQVGKYTVLIGNKISDKNNTRYIYTGTVTIPGPKDIAIDTEHDLIAHSYVDANTILNIGIANPEDASTLIYTWYKDNVVIPNVTGSSYKPEDEGIYYCTVQNTRNGVTTEVGNATTSNKADIRVHPQKVTSVNLVYDAETQVFTATAEHTYLNHMIEYTWTRVFLDETNRKQNETVRTAVLAGPDSYKPTLPGLYYVEAVEVVFQDYQPLIEKGGLGAMTRSDVNIELDENLNVVIPDNSIVG